MRNLIQPAGQSVSPSDRPGPLHHHQEGGLEGILGVIGIAEDAAADAQHHRPVPRHQRLEGAGISLFDEAVKELRVGQPRDDAPGEQSLDLPQCHTPSVSMDIGRDPPSPLPAHSNESGTGGDPAIFFQRARRRR